MNMEYEHREFMAQVWAWKGQRHLAFAGMERLEAEERESSGDE